jgi:hypothetical protein
VTHSTLSGNSANSAGGGIFRSSGSVVVTDSIVANSPGGGNCGGLLPITDLGNNFADDDTCAPGFASIAPGVDFDEELADNGGSTQTHALFPGSLAIDGPDFEFTVVDTGGCSCEQIIEMMDLGWGHTKFGCSTGAMLQWIATVGGFRLARPEVEAGPSTGSIQTLMEDADDSSPSTRSKSGDPGSQRDRSLRRPRRDGREPGPDPPGPDPR